MKVEEAEPSLRALLRMRGLELERLSGPDAFELMVGFYLDEHVEGVIAQAGDMLLFQWGAYGSDSAPTFQYDITRQFITGTGEDDDDFWQLSLTSHYKLSDAARRLGSGNQWCWQHADAPGFVRFVRAHPAHEHVSELSPLYTQLRFGQAG